MSSITSGSSPYELSKEKKITLIYIAGYGRSGSTLLDTMLDSHSKIVGAGELRWLPSFRAKGELCSNNHYLDNCPVWGRFDRASRDHAADRALQKATVASERLLSSNKHLDVYLSGWERELRNLSLNSKINYIVDSSKSCHNVFRRPILLNKIPCVEVKVIHLVREPRAVMWSLIRVVDRQQRRFGSIQKPIKVFKGCIGRIVANKLVSKISNSSTGIKKIEIGYESIVEDPDRAFEAIGKFIGLDLEYSKIRSTTLSSSCAIGGNRMRKSSLSVINEDEEWKSRLPVYASVLHFILYRFR